MISPEILRRYPFFSRFSEQHLLFLADAAREETVAPDHIFFREGDLLKEFYLLLEGDVVVLMELPDRSRKQSLSRQLMRDLVTKEIATSSVTRGDIFGWSALLPPFRATAKARALSPCRLATFNSRELRSKMEEDCAFGYVLMEKIAQLVRDRLQDSRVETLAYFVTE